MTLNRCPTPLAALANPNGKIMSEIIGIDPICVLILPNIYRKKIFNANLNYNHGCRLYLSAGYLYKLMLNL